MNASSGLKACLTAVVACGLLAASGCADHAPSPAADQERFVTVDSAGVSVSTSLAPRWGTEVGWTVSDVPELEIGAVEGTPEEILHAVVTVLPRESGLLVAESQGLRLYSDDGAFEGTLGGRGEGPGEVRSSIASAILCDGQVALTEFSGSRATIFSAEGGPRTVDLPFRAGATTRQGAIVIVSIRLRGCLAGGGLLLMTGTSSDPDEVVRPPVAVLRVDLESGGVDTVLTVPGPETHAGSALPFGRRTLVAAAGSHLYVADTGLPEIRVKRPDGTLLRIYRLATGREALSGGEVERYVERRIEGASSVQVPALRERLAATPFPDSLPWIDDLRIGGDGTLWLQRHRSVAGDGEEAAPWIVISPEGEWLGEVRLPDALDEVSFGPDWVLGVHRDDLGVPFVRRYRILRD
jgi:hypothetical protein